VTKKYTGTTQYMWCFAGRGSHSTLAVLGPCCFWFTDLCWWFTFLLSLG